MSIIQFMRFFLGTILSATILFAMPIFASVREGTDAFRKGEYSKAAEIFEQAANESPDDLRLEFNRGSALVAAGKFDAAVESLKKSAVAADPVVASKSLVLLGQIAVSRAKESMNESPELPDSSRRKDILDQLRLAERFYAEALDAEPSERSARTALEQIRAWRSRTVEQWNLADRIPQRQQAIPERLRQLEDWERSIGRSIRENRDATDSPKKFQAFYETAKDQRRLTDEVVALQNDWKRISTDSNGEDETEVQTVQVFLDELDRLRTSTENVGQKLRSFQGREALDELRESVDRISRLRIHLSPFEAIVREAEKKQDELCKTDSEDREFSSDDQQRIADWMPVMVRRAQQGLQAEGQNAELSVEETQALKQSMELAVQYGPEIQKLAQNAARFLKNGELETALPDQQHALELLREILKPLKNPQDPNRQDSNQQDPNQQDPNRQNQDGEDSPDSNSQDQNSQDSGPRDREPKNESGSQQQESDKRNEKERGDQESNSDEEKDSENQKKKQDEQDAPGVSDKKKDESPNPNDPEALSPEQKQEIEKAERMLRQVKRKQQEAEERRKRVRALLLQLEPVDKDW